jgi:hypothetical protein
MISERSIVVRAQKSESSLDVANAHSDVSLATLPRVGANTVPLNFPSAQASHRALVVDSLAVLPDLRGHSLEPGFTLNPVAHPHEKTP